MADNIGTIGEIYEAFQRGDVPAILERMSDDVSWDQGVRDTGLPWLVPGRGKDHVLRFFQALGAGVAFDLFQPTTFAEQGDTVVVIIREDLRSLHTGRTTGEDLYAHIWRFGPDGKVAEFRHLGDWARHEAACH